MQAVTGGMPDTIEDGTEGLLVEPDNVTALQSALYSMMGDRELRERMGRAGAERIRLRNNHEAFARQMEAEIIAYLDSVGASLSSPEAKHHVCNQATLPTIRLF